MTYFVFKLLVADMFDYFLILHSEEDRPKKKKKKYELEKTARQSRKRVL